MMVKFYLGLFIAALLAIVPSTHSNEVDTLRVMSYNIKAAQESSLDQIVSVIEAHDPDIVALQEVDVHWRDRSNYRDQARYLGEALNMHFFFAEIYALSPDKGQNEIRKYGLAFLSKYPFTWKKNHFVTRLSSLAEETKPAKLPGFPEVSVEVDGHQVRLFNTHLDYRSDPGIRETQVDDMLAILHAAEYPTVLMGDFNAEPDDPELSKLFNKLTDVWYSQDSKGFTYPANNPEKRIDYILHSDHFKVSNAFVIETQASDHLPVVADISLK